MFNLNLAVILKKHFFYLDLAKNFLYNLSTCDLDNLIEFFFRR